MPEPVASPRAVLFDLDGTLIDSFPAIAASVNHVRALRGQAPLSVADVTRHVGLGAWHLLSHTVEGGDLEANVAAYREHHPTVLRDLTQLLPGAKEVLFALKGQGRRLGICSNKPVAFTRELVGHLQVAPALDVVLGPEDVGRHKPAPDMLLEAMRRLGCRADETLYVGDMTVDVQTGRAAGVPVWVVATGTDSAEMLDGARPDRRLARLADLPGLLGCARPSATAGPGRLLSLLFGPGPGTFSHGRRPQVAPVPRPEGGLPWRD